MSTAAEPVPFRIRCATAADSELLASLGAETFADTFSADNTPENMAAYLSASFSPARQAREIADPASRFLILESDDHPVGYAHVHVGSAPQAVRGRRPMEIVRIYARRHWIGKGVGARLMDACLVQAVEAGCDVVWLGVWARNARAIRFYLKAGFRQVGVQTFQLGKDTQQDWIMARPVAPAREPDGPEGSPASTAPADSTRG
jgi:GNAT superfamily N-acetyltransferase